VDTSDDPVVERQLGTALGEWRKLSGLNQTQLARRLTYDRTTVAHAERGAQIPAEEFWQACDRLLAANGALLHLYQALQEARQRRTAEAAAKARAERRARLTALTVGDSAAVVPSDGLGPPLLPERLRPTQRLVAEQVTPITRRYRSLYHHLPSTYLLPAVTGHLHLLDRLLGRAGDGSRRQLAAEVAETAGLAAWLYGEAGDSLRTARLYRLADDAADLSGDRALAGYVRGFWAQALIDRGEYLRGLAEFDVARELAGRGQPALGAWLAAVHAHALALAGRGSEALGALGFAERELHRGGSAAVAEWMYAFDAPRLAAHRGGCLLRLGDVAGAGTALAEALAALPAGCARRRAEVVLELADVRLIEGQAEEAVRLAAAAVDGFAARGSLPGLRRAARFATALTAAGQTAGARALRQHILACSPP